MFCHETLSNFNNTHKSCIHEKFTHSVSSETNSIRSSYRCNRRFWCDGISLSKGISVLISLRTIDEGIHILHSLNCFLVCSKVNRQLSVSFAFELTPGQWSRCTENWTTAFGEFHQHLFRDVIPNSLWIVLFHRIPFLLGTWTTNDHRPLPNFFASVETTSTFAKHFSSLSFSSQEMSLDIDINRMLPVKVSGVSPNLLSRSVTLSQSCIVNPGKMFHSNSVGSPLIPS